MKSFPKPWYFEKESFEVALALVLMAEKKRSREVIAGDSRVTAMCRPRPPKGYYGSMTVGSIVNPTCYVKPKRIESPTPSGALVVKNVTGNTTVQGPRRRRKKYRQTQNVPTCREQTVTTMEGWVEIAEVDFQKLGGGNGHTKGCGWLRVWMSLSLNVLTAYNSSSKIARLLSLDIRDIQSLELTFGGCGDTWILKIGFEPVPLGKYPRFVKRLGVDSKDAGGDSGENPAMTLTILLQSEDLRHRWLNCIESALFVTQKPKSVLNPHATNFIPGATRLCTRNTSSSVNDSENMVNKEQFDAHRAVTMPSILQDEGSVKTCTLAPAGCIPSVKPRSPHYNQSLNFSAPTTDPVLFVSTNSSCNSSILPLAGAPQTSICVTRETSTSISSIKSCSSTSSLGDTLYLPRASIPNCSSNSSIPAVIIPNCSSSSSLPAVLTPNCSSASSLPGVLYPPPLLVTPPTTPGPFVSAWYTLSMTEDVTEQSEDDDDDDEHPIVAAIAEVAAKTFASIWEEETETTN